MCISLIITGSISFFITGTFFGVHFGFAEFIVPYLLYFRFYKKEKLGLKRLTIRTFTPPLTIINGVLIKPLKLVVKRVIKILGILREIAGWAMLGILIGSVWVIINNPDYDAERQQIAVWLNEKIFRQIWRWAQKK
uniref:Uncharacterized protein n=1 Tax=Iridovirus LCIVAC01 TaxID=2506607 RepID=A0A481YRX5_9VIRU|nr:MAG: hypothetical protein LCIVAC01_00130 [Iridovirus LCIVAC01]